LVSKLHSSLKNKPNLKVEILFDYLRGTRGKQNETSVFQLMPLIEEFKGFFKNRKK